MAHEAEHGACVSDSDAAGHGSSGSSGNASRSPARKSYRRDGCSGRATHGATAARASGRSGGNQCTASKAETDSAKAEAEIRRKDALAEADIQRSDAEMIARMNRQTAEQEARLAAKFVSERGLQTLGETPL